MEGGVVSLGQQAEELAQARKVFLQERRQLKQHRPVLGVKSRKILSRDRREARPL
jgi:hypothetical protein